MGTNFLNFNIVEEFTRDRACIERQTDRRTDRRTECINTFHLVEKFKLKGIFFFLHQGIALKKALMVLGVNFGCLLSFILFYFVCS